jgi:hypothetical protein
MRVLKTKKNILYYFEKRSSLLQRLRCSWKLKSRRIGSRGRFLKTLSRGVAQSLS